MRLADLELDTDYAYDGWHTTPDRVRIDSLDGKPRYSSGRRRNAVEGQLLDRFTGEWNPTTLLLAKIISRWDDPEQVKLRSRLASMDAEANRLRAMLETLGLTVYRPGQPSDRGRPPEAFVRAYLARDPDDPPTIDVEVKGAAFRRVMAPLLEEWDEARADFQAG